ncbi:hypothetical protein BDZ89DRAFT_1138892 [Hymenopellis radicata]|nr:hypothetical protein BDZ89DRAFT_1138892 [Hymenopellis radicata]
MNKAELDTLIRGAERLQPPESKRKKRQPYTVEYIEEILKDLDLNIPLDAACASCLTTTFYAVGRLGEFTIPTLKSFRPGAHVTLSNRRRGSDRNGFQTVIFHIPSTKSDPANGEDLYWAQQIGSTDPEDLFNNHLRVNGLLPNSHLFAYRHVQGEKETLRPMTKPAFIARIHKAAKNRGLKTLQGHGIRIGATLEYLLRGVPFDAVKVMGRWKSDAFLLYLRRHSEIMAPYMQPDLHQEFIRYTMPPVRCEYTPSFGGIRGRWMRRPYSFVLGIAADHVHKDSEPLLGPKASPSPTTCSSLFQAHTDSKLTQIRTDLPST